MILYNGISVGLTRPTRREEFHSPLCASNADLWVGLVVNLGKFSKVQMGVTSSCAETRVA
jgi:hypothetical protein